MFSPLSASVKLIQSSFFLLMVIADLSALNSGMIAGAATRLTSLPSITSPQPAAEISLVQASKPFPLKDGTYLYGQSPQPEQLGQEYLVFKVASGKVIGAFYLPRSEYSCFSGQVTANQLSLSIRDPYDKSVSDYAIALKPQEPIAANNQKLSGMNLEGYHAINKLSANDRRLLDACMKDEY